MQDGTMYSQVHPLVPHYKDTLARLVVTYNVNDPRNFVLGKLNILYLSYEFFRRLIWSIYWDENGRNVSCTSLMAEIDDVLKVSLNWQIWASLNVSKLEEKIT